MFGLMKNTSCGQSDQPDWYRLHYCGTCKSLGQIYGHRSRLFLNHDIVFLAEILSLLQESQTQNWDPALHSKKCFELPKEENLPLSLQYAADINTILVELKVRDNVSDEFSQVWKLTKRFLNRPFSKIQERVKKWGIDDQKLLELQLEDSNRAFTNPSQKTMEELLSFHAEPSAKITGYLFAKGTEVIDKTDEQDTIYKIGFAFGELTYGLDAWRDFENDREDESFNPLLFFPQQSIADRKSAAENWVWKKADEIQSLIEKVNLEEKIKHSLQGRLQMNLAAALSEDAQVVRPKTDIGKSTVPTAVRTFWKTYRNITSWINPMRPTRFVVGYLVFFFVFFQQKLLAAVDIRPKDDLEKSSRSNDKVKKDLIKYRREVRKANREARKEFRKQKRQHRKNIGHIILLSFGIGLGIFIILIGIIILDLTTISSGILLATLGILLGLSIIFLSILGMIKVHKKRKQG